MKKMLGILVVIFLSLSLKSVSQALYEDFNYAVPSFTGGNTGTAGSTSNNWVTHSVTSGQTTTIDVVSGNLSYPGLLPPNGNKIFMFGNTNLMSRDINRAFSFQGPVCYYSVLLEVIDNSGLTAGGDFFMHFGSAAGNSAGSFGGRVGAKSVSGGNNYRLLVQNNSSGTPTFTEYPQDLSYGTTYLVVVKYDKSVAPTSASLWVNPLSLGGTEPSGCVVNNSGTSGFGAFASLCLRNSATTPKLWLDEFRTGATWASVTPTNCDTVPPETNFWANLISINEGDSVDFYDSTLNCPVSWSWSFVGGEPMSSEEQNPKGIIFNYAGTYHVCLTTTNNSGSNTNCKMNFIVVNGPPEPADAHIIISEIMYNPPETGVDTIEFFELYNNDSSSVSLANYTVSDGVSFTFPPVEMLPHSFLILAKDSGAFRNTFGVGALQWTNGSLSNSGELILIRDNNGFTVDSVAYDNSLPWNTQANGRGPSLEACIPDSDNSVAENWRPALEFAAINADDDSIFASPLYGCMYPPVAGFMSDFREITPGSSVIFSDTSTGIINSWTWTFENGNPSSSAQEMPPPITYCNIGTFRVELKVTNSFGSNTLIRPGYITVGPSDIHKNDKKFLLYPNPSKGKFILKTEGNGGLVNIRILTSTGITICEKEYNAGEISLDLSRLSNGLYFMKIIQNDMTRIEKIIIRK